MLVFLVDELYIHCIPDNVQGDPSGCSIGFVDIKAKFLIHHMLLILIGNSYFDLNSTLGKT